MPKIRENKEYPRFCTFLQALSKKKGKENAARKNHRKRPMAMPPKEKGGIYIYSCINSGVSFRQNNHPVLFGSFNPYFFLAL